MSLVCVTSFFFVGGGGGGGGGEGVRGVDTLSRPDRFGIKNFWTPGKNL